MWAETLHGSCGRVEGNSTARYRVGVAGRALAIVLLLVAGCDSRTYRGVGDLVDRDRDSATIAHEDIPGLMPAMVMRFPARPPSILEGAVAGTRVRFEFVREGDQLSLTSISPIGLGKGGPPGEHDHRPRHGGGRETARVELGSPIVKLAVWRDGRRVATAARDRRLRVHALRSRVVYETLAWHRGVWDVGG